VPSTYMINSSFSFSVGMCFFFDFVLLVALKENVTSASSFIPQEIDNKKGW